MYLSPLQPASNSQVYVSGDVAVDQSVALGPGVILIAEPNSRIEIATGTCIGMGCVIHARQGILKIEAGVVLGAGGLIVGAGHIGANACVGSGATLINPAIESQKILAAGCLLGDTSRQVEAELEPELSPPEAEAETVVEPQPDLEPTRPESPPENNPEPAPQSPQPLQTSSILYGQAHIQNLLSTLLPHRAALNRNGQSPSP